MSETPVDERITKKRVTMKSAMLRRDGAIEMHEATDYVREDFLEAYVTDALTRWQFVEVSEEYDAGPGGYHGSTYVPEGLDHPEAGVFHEATGDRAAEERAAFEEARTAFEQAAASEPDQEA